MISHGGYAPNDFADYDNDPGDAIDGLKVFLRQLAWNGLTMTATFQELYPKDSPEELQITKTIKDEAFPNDGGSTPKGNSPVPCT
ncbi:MAG: hypothetical protein AAF934_11045 [Bacteroidota bacterium]